MNHDYAHCLDFQNSCPASCFRAKLSRDLEKHREEYIKIPLTWSFFRETEYCPLGNCNKVNEDDRGRSKSRNQERTVHECA